MDCTNSYFVIYPDWRGSKSIARMYDEANFHFQNYFFIRLLDHVSEYFETTIVSKGIYNQ